MAKSQFNLSKFAAQGMASLAVLSASAPANAIDWTLQPYRYDQPQPPVPEKVGIKSVDYICPVGSANDVANEMFRNAGPDARAYDSDADAAAAQNAAPPAPTTQNETAPIPRGLIVGLTTNNGDRMIGTLYSGRSGSLSMRVEARNRTPILDHNVFNDHGYPISHYSFAGTYNLDSGEVTVTRMPQGAADDNANAAAQYLKAMFDKAMHNTCAIPQREIHTIWGVNGESYYPYAESITSFKTAPSGYYVVAHVTESAETRFDIRFEWYNPDCNQYYRGYEITYGPSNLLTEVTKDGEPVGGQELADKKFLFALGRIAVQQHLKGHDWFLGRVFNGLTHRDHRPQP